MKKILAVILFVLSFVTIMVVKAEECDSFYKVSINILGEGSIIVSGSDKKISEDTTINLKCNDDFVFTGISSENNILAGVYHDGNNLVSNENKYGIYNINSNTNIKVVFKKPEKEDDNVISYSSTEDNISLFIDDIKEQLKPNTKMKISLKEIDIIFDNAFLKNSNNSITIVGNEIYKDDLNFKQKRITNNSIYYDFYLYSEDKVINDLKGSASISIPYSKSKNVYVYRLAKDGKITLINSQYKNDSITFTVNKFGSFVISDEKLDELNYVRNTINANNKKIISITAVILALCLLFVFIKAKKRR